MKKTNISKIIKWICIFSLFAIILCPTAYAAGTDVAGTTTTAFNTYMKPQIKELTNNVLLPIADVVVLGYLVFNSILAYSSYKSNGGRFEWHLLAILVGCLIFGLSSPLWEWGLIGW